MNLAKQAIAFALASVFTFGTAAFAAEDGNSVTITQRDSYIDENGNGNLRFITEVKLAAEKIVEKFGTWVVPKDLFAGWDNTEDGHKVLTVENDEADMITSDNGDGTKTGYFTTDIMGIPAGLCGEEFYAKSFVVYKDSETDTKKNWLQAPLASDNVNNSETKKVVEGSEDQHKPTYYTSIDTSSASEENPDKQNANVNRSDAVFSKVFQNTDKYLYRVGNGNDVKLSSLFSCEGTPITPDVTITNKAGNAGGSYTSKATWGEGTIQFTGTGVVEVTITDKNDPINNAACTLLLEVVDGKNVTGSAQSATANNVVLLEDVTLGEIQVTNGYAIYGNGFKMSRTTDAVATSRVSSYFVRLENGILDNVQVICPDFSHAILYESNKEESDNYSEPDSKGTIKYGNIRSAVTMYGSSKIENSYISGGRAAVYVLGENQQIINSTINGGAAANIDVDSAKSLLLKDVTTIQEPRQSTVNGTKTLMGLGVVDVGGNTPITIKGKLRQHNWVYSDYIEYVRSDLQQYVNLAFSDPEYQYTINGKTCVNEGFLSISGTPNIIDERDSSEKQEIPYDLALNKVYTCKKVTVPNEEIISDYLPYSPSKYSAVNPTMSFVDEDTRVTYSDSYVNYEREGKIKISIKYGTEYVLDTSDIKIKKNGHDVPYSIFEGQTDITGTQITLRDITSKTYSIIFADTDIYDSNGELTGEAVEHEYTLDVDVSLTDLPAPVKASDSSQGTGIQVAQSYGGNWQAAVPAFTGVKITYWSVVENKLKTISLKDDIDLSSYNKGKAGTTTSWSYDKKFGDVRDYTLTISATGLKDGKTPEVPVIDTEGEVYFTASDVSDSSGFGVSGSTSSRTCKLTYSFKDGNNNEMTSFTNSITVTYNKEAQYSHSEFINSGTHSSYLSGCFAAGTLITLADGTKKPIEDIEFGDVVLTYSFYEGGLKQNPVIAIERLEDVPSTELEITLSNGTSVNAITYQSFFDMDERKYFEVNATNYKESIGKNIMVLNGNKIDTATITQIKANTKNMDTYELISAYDFNYFANDILSCEPFIFCTNIFDIDENYKVDTDSMEKDIETYGLYSYDEFSDYMTEEEFNVFNGPYFKVAVGKGLIDIDYIFKALDKYKNEYDH